MLGSKNWLELLLRQNYNINSPNGLFNLLRLQFVVLPNQDQWTETSTKAVETKEVHNDN